MRLNLRGTAFRERIAALFRDREIFVRTGGQVKFIRLSARVQRRIAGLLAIVFLVLASITSVAVVRDLTSAAERAELTRQQTEVGAAEAKVAAYLNHVGNVADDLDARQDYLETMTAELMGTDASGATTARSETQLKARKTSSFDIRDNLTAFARIRDRQNLYAAALTRTVDRRAERAEGAIRRFGLDPRRLGRSQVAVGGPFVAFHANGRKVDDLGPHIAGLDKALIRMERLERALVAIPSARPADVAMVTSSYGYRRDPFTGAAAFHSGLDFPGAVGTPIHAAAAGRIVFVGQRSGYGNVVEVDHGQGIVTRYAHLSRFAVKRGQRVAAGVTIARMGSTGRSTGPHLHFEVRLRGQAMDPRKFLEAKQDVLEIKAVAERRITDQSNPRGAA